MNGILKENQLTIVKEYEFDNSLIHKLDPIRDCHNKYFHTFDHVCMILFLRILCIKKYLI